MKTRISVGLSTTSPFLLTHYPIHICCDEGERTQQRAKRNVFGHVDSFLQENQINVNGTVDLVGVRVRP
jgi:hypothetical protein